MDANGRPSTIILKINEGTRYEEARAAGAIKPGHLIMKDANGAVVVHATAGGNTALLIATEEINVLQGKTKDDAFASGDLVSYRPLSKGDEVQVWLADNIAATAGGKLESNGDGTFRLLAAGTALMEIVETLTTVGGAAAAALIRARAL